MPYEIAFIIRRLQRQPNTHPSTHIATAHLHPYLTHRVKGSRQANILGILRGTIGAGLGLPIVHTRLKALDLRGNMIPKEPMQQIAAVCLDKGVHVDM